MKIIKSTLGFFQLSTFNFLLFVIILFPTKGNSQFSSFLTEVNDLSLLNQTDSEEINRILTTRNIGNHKVIQISHLPNFLVDGALSNPFSWELSNKQFHTKYGYSE